MKDQEKKINLRNKLLNDALFSWDLENVDLNVSEIGLNLKRYYKIFLSLHTYLCKKCVYKDRKFFRGNGSY